MYFLNPTTNTNTINYTLQQINHPYRTKFKKETTRIPRVGTKKKEKSYLPRTNKLQRNT